MSRKVWQQRLLESVFVFFTDDLKHALFNQISGQLQSNSKVIWPVIAENLRPFFVFPDEKCGYIGNIVAYMHKIRLGDTRYSEKDFETLIDAQCESHEAFMQRIANIPTTDEEIAIYIKLARDFEIQLDAMEDDEISSAYRKLELELEAINRRQRDQDGSERDQFAFFNELTSNARFHYWLQMSAWNIDECIALSLGKEPKRVNAETLQLKVRPRFHSPFREIFKSRHEILRRAQLHGRFEDLITPSDFVAWARDLRWDLPSEIDQALAKRPKLDALSDSTASGPSLSTLYRLLLGMAIARFEHRTDRNSLATAQIEEELRYLQQLDNTGFNTLGKIEVKNDTIRKSLEAAAAHLGASWPETIRWKGTRRPKSEI